MADTSSSPTRPRVARPWARFTIGRLMVVIALAGCVSACFRDPIVGEIVTGAAVNFAAVAVASVLSYRLDQPGRLLIARRVAALWPLSIPISLHVGWVIAYGCLGRPLRPPDNGFWVGVLEITVIFFMLSSIVFLMVVTPVLAAVAVEWGDRSRARTWLLLPLAWIATIAIMNWDPVGAGLWFVD